MKFRKKPVVVEAFQTHPNDGLTRRLPPGWMIEALLSGRVVINASDGAFMIKTLEGVMRAEVGDWIIRGVKGELYPCKPDIFEATYEPAEQA